MLISKVLRIFGGITSNFTISTKIYYTMIHKVYHVKRNGRDGWKGVLEHSKHSPVTGESKQDVIKRTIAMAKCHSKCSVIIHKIDGSIQEEYSFPRSAS